MYSSAVALGNFECVCTEEAIIYVLGYSQMERLKLLFGLDYCLLMIALEPYLKINLQSLNEEIQEHHLYYII